MPVFVASDGTKFEDRNAWRRYEFETNYTFRNKTNETLVKLPGSIGGQPFDLSDLDGCEVQLLDQCDQVQLDNLTDCRVFIGPCCESVFVRNCSNCVFTIACKQLRTRDCTDCTVALYSLTDPIIETSSGMAFAPYNGAYHGIQQHFQDARLEPDNNHWSLVYDFNDPDKSGCNWRLLKPNEAGEPWVLDLTGRVPDAAALGPCVNPVPADAGYVTYEDSGSSSSSSSSSNASAMQSFSFHTTQQEAEKVVAAATTAAVVPSIAVCQAQEPALAMPAPPMPMPLPPAPVQALAGGAGASPPPPAPMPSTVTENQKVAAVEAAELLAPPACPGASCCSSKNVTEPAMEVAMEKAVDKLQELSLGVPAPPTTSTM